METAKGKSREEISQTLANRIDNFEKYARPHSRLMAALAARLAHRFGLAPPDVHAIAEAALLHDIGLYMMSPAYHSSPDSLSFEQRMDLWRHPIIGEQQMAKREATRHAQLLVRWHHEWWNGSGYPDMLAFEDIPIGARLLRAVELYSALTSARPYRATLTSEQAIEALKTSAGIECDPYVVKALVALLEEIGGAAAEDTTAAMGEPSDRAGAELPPPQGELSALAAELSGAEVGGVRPEDYLPPATTAHFESAPRRTRDLAPPGSSTESGALPAERVEALILRAESKEPGEGESPQWRGWRGSRYSRKSFLGFEASVLRQLEFRSIAIPFCGWARLDWYLKAWGKLILLNDPRHWASALARAMVEAREPLAEEQIASLLEDVYVPGTRLANPELRQWFGESDAWWMDNLRRNVEAIGDEAFKAQALVLGLQTGDYALSFNEETRDVRRPLTTVFWRLAGRLFTGPPGHPHNRSYNLPAEEFIKQSRADLLYLTLPPAHVEQGGAEARAGWRESWVRAGGGAGVDDVMRLTTLPQSKQAYLMMVDRMLRAALHVRTWAIGYQEVGLASAHDIGELIKEYRPVRATYSKDLTEVAGGLRGYIIVADKAPAAR